MVLSMHLSSFVLSHWILPGATSWYVIGSFHSIKIKQEFCAELIKLTFLLLRFIVLQIYIIIIIYFSFWKNLVCASSVLLILIARNWNAWFLGWIKVAAFIPDIMKKYLADSEVERDTRTHTHTIFWNGNVKFSVFYEGNDLWLTKCIIFARDGITCRSQHIINI
jgi:hypothetical protein